MNQKLTPHTIRDLHPASKKHALKGHPWITLDRFSATWPKATLLLHLPIGPQKIWTYLHDPKHPFCKARLLSQEKIGTLSEAIHLLKNNFMSAVEKRKDLITTKERSHFILCFGEADLVPGLQVIYLGGHWLVQIQALYWNDLQKEVLSWIKDASYSLDLPRHHVWWQERGNNQMAAKVWQNNSWQKFAEKFTVNEAGLQFQLELGARYDHGIYTDMADIRSQLSQDMTLWDQQRVLNLFSYTGTFSAFALQWGAKQCTSLDASKAYLQTLQNNLRLNSIDEAKHEFVCADITLGLNQLIKDNKKFDTIILDPPSSFTTGGKKTQVLAAYPKILQSLEKICSFQGRIICFLNHHQTGRQKFELLVKKTLPNWVFEKSLQLNNDAPRLNYFPEGDYLHGIILKRKA